MLIPKMRLEKAVSVVLVLVWMFNAVPCAKKSSVRKSERLSPPLDIQLETVNCTSISIQWKMPRRHVTTITGYKVFYTEMRNNRLVGAEDVLEVPLSLEMLTTGQFDGQASFDIVIGKLKVGTQYRVSVGAFGWAGEGRPSMPRDISTASHETCMPPSPPAQPIVVAVSETELALSWQHRDEDESAPVLHFLVAYIRPEMDTEWTYIREAVESNSMVLKGLVPETQYQFIIRAVNVFGISPPSPINSPVRTLGAVDMSSGDYDVIISNTKDGDGLESDDSDDDVFIAQMTSFPHRKQSNRRSSLRSRTGTPGSTIFRMRSRNISFTSTTTSTASVTKTTASGTTPIAAVTTTTASGTTLIAAVTLTTASGTTTTASGTTTTASGVAPIAAVTMTTPSGVAPTAAVTMTTTSGLAPFAAATMTTASGITLPAGPSLTPWKGEDPRVYDVSCEDVVCPPDSFCINDFDSGGSRCHCNLGRHGPFCSQGLTVNFPKFSGSSHMTFEPLKHSYQSFHISLELKAEAEDGLLLYCGENEHGRGDFLSLALVRRKLHYRFNCGTGPAQIVSESSVVIGQWHTVTLFRNGMNGWLRLDNDTPVSGRSQGHYTKITFRTPLFVGGAPSAYWLVRAVGTNGGFQGCVQSLSVNSKVIDLRPWPKGNALSGADIGECSSSVCDDVTCMNGGMCLVSGAESFLCLCPLGFKGVLCEESFLLSLPQFNASMHSYASAAWPQPIHSYLSFMEFDITFRPANQDGTLLYTDDTESRDFLSISLVRGHVEFRFDCGSGATLIRSHEALAVGMWHDLRASRTAKNGILQVDDHRPVEGTAEGAFTQIRCSSPLYIGGVPDYDVIKSSAGVLRPFSGAIQKISLNDRSIELNPDQAFGMNVLNADHPCVQKPCANGGVCRPKWDDYECDCTLGYDGRHCQKECGNYCLNTVTESIEMPQFTGRSYLTYDNRDILKRLSGSRTNIFMRFKSTSEDGLLFWRGESPMRANSDFMSLGLQDGALIFSYNLGSGGASVIINGSFSDGKWHRVKAVRDGQFGKLTADDYGTKTARSPGKMRQLNINAHLYIGGMKEIALHTNRKYMRGLVGCVSHVTLATDHHLSLVEDATDGKNINTCTN